MPTGAAAAGEIGAVELGAIADNAYRYLDEDGTLRINARGRVKTATSASSIPTVPAPHRRERELIIRGGVNISRSRLTAR